MNPGARVILVSVAAGVVAMLLGWQIANGKVFSMDLVGAVAGGAVVIALCAILVQCFRQPVDVITLGLVIFGYIVGNRGFAQLMPAPSLPLLPAEAVLLIAGGWWLISSAFARRLPWEYDALNVIVLLWLVLGSARLIFDVRPYGLVAVRDFATVYYALYFFIAQRIARTDSSRRFVINTALVASVLVLPGIILTDAFPEFFFGQLTVRGLPLIYYKGDLGHIFVGVGSLLLFFWAKGKHRVWAWPLSAAMFLFVVSGNSRATAVGLLAAIGLLLITRHWRFPALQAATVGMALVVMVVMATFFNNGWADKKLSGISERLYSMIDLRGTGTYQSEDSFNKGDNNLFRLVWWENVVRDTWEGNAVFGLGFGYDLAQRFVREYFPEATDEFSARSPHNIFLTVFGRLGIAGVIVWGGLCLVMLRETWRSLRDSTDTMQWALWCSLWLVMIGASLGVVLEGPMGAVPFWTLLGVAHQPAEPADDAEGDVVAP
ncbi:MAG: O-antigen ligase family protein [Opitutaceae bacterium]|nr:O-antigen ligase family protein [Opitutaceae bacterium]